MLQPSAISELQERITRYEDMAAYEELYNLLFDPLYKFSFSIVKSREAAEEIVSDVFIKIWAKRTELSHIINLREYMFRIARNYCFTYTARKNKAPVISLNHANVESLVSGTDPENYSVSAELAKKIAEILEGLPPQCKLVFQLVKEEGMEYKEVASILDISVHTVRNQLVTAVKRFYAGLPGYVQNPGLRKGNKTA